MLVLGRHIDQSVIIKDRRTGEQICEVIVVQKRGDKIRLGFVAPRHIVIDRKEIDDIKQEEERA